MKRKVVSVILATTLTIGVLSGCGSDNSANVPVSTEEAGAAAEEVTANVEEGAVAENGEDLVTENVTGEDSWETVALRARAANNAISHIDSVVAKNAGFYEGEGLDVELAYNPSNPENIQALLADQADLVGAGSAAVLNYIDEGADIVIIGGQMSLGETLYVQADRAEEFSQLTEETLAGKKVGVTRMNTGDIAFRKILLDRGVDLSKIEFVELDSQATVTEAVIKGEVDLGINFLTYREVAEAQGLVPISQLDAEDEWPDYICCRLFTTRDKLEANREAYVRALKANIKAYELIQTDQEATLKAAEEAYSIEEDILINELYGYGHLGLSPNPDVKNTTQYYQAMVDIGYTEGNVDIADYIDASLYIEALDELLAEDPDNEIYLALKAESDATNY